MLWSNPYPYTDVEGLRDSHASVASALPCQHSSTVEHAAHAGVIGVRVLMQATRRHHHPSPPVMLSVIILSAITAVALPSLRITTLSMVRVMSLCALIMVYGVALTMTPAAPTSDMASSTLLFDGIVTTDALGMGAVGLVMATLAMCLMHYTSQGSNSGIHAASYTLVLLLGIMLLGSYTLATSSDLVTLALSLELQSFSVYAVTTLYRWRTGATAAGLMYFMLGAFSSGLVLLGVSLLYAYTGQTTYDSVISLSLQADTTWLAVIVLLCGLLFKLAAAPFHYWGPTVYDNVPTTVTLIITLMPKAALLALLVRTSPLWSGGVPSMLLACVVLSLTIGSVLGLVQTRIKRVLAYSTISHVGWMLLSLAVGGVLGLGSLGFYVAQYSFTTGLSLLVLIALGYTSVATGERSAVNPGDVESVKTLWGLYTQSISLSLLMGLSLLSAAGIPPLMGFYAKLSVIQAAMSHSQYLVVAVGIITSVVSAGFYLSVVAGIAFKQQETQLD